jgi:hypothetical protein
VKKGDVVIDRKARIVPFSKLDWKGIFIFLLKRNSVTREKNSKKMNTPRKKA